MTRVTGSFVLLCTLCINLMRTLTDEFYLFSKRPAPPPPSVIPASELKPDTDLVNSLLEREGPGNEEVVSLAGAKSGLRVSFATNRACTHQSSVETSLTE